MTRLRGAAAAAVVGVTLAGLSQSHSGHQVLTHVADAMQEPVISSTSPAANKALADRMAATAGWDSHEIGCLNKLWQRESGFRVTVWNYQGADAYGIPQANPASKMASAGPDWRTDPATQIKWGLGYVASIYTTPCRAWAHEKSAGWY